MKFILREKDGRSMNQAVKHFITLAAAHLTAITLSVKQCRQTLYISLCTLVIADPIPAQTFKNHSSLLKAFKKVHSGIKK